MTSHCLGHRCNFPPTSTTLLPFITFLLFHCGCSVCVQLSLLYFAALCSLTPFPAVYWLSTSSRVLHLKYGTLWHSAQIAAFPLQFFILATPGSSEICLRPSICFWIALPDLNQPIVHILLRFSFASVFIPPIFPSTFLHFCHVHHILLLV